MKHTPHPALIGSYNNARDLNDMLAAAKAWRKQIHEEAEEAEKAKRWNVAHLKTFFDRFKI